LFSLFSLLVLAQHNTANLGHRISNSSKEIRNRFLVIFQYQSKTLLPRNMKYEYL
jgi:hypothetical protein